MENKDRYELFKSVYLTLLEASIKDSSKNGFRVEEVNMEELHRKVFSRAFMLTAYVVNDVKESKIIF